MVLWRISRYHDLSGIGGLKAAARWHELGQPVVYLSQTPASALLEVCVHTAANDIPPEFTLLKVEAPPVRIEHIRMNQLPENWPTRIEITRNLGTEWLKRRKTALLRVPSAIIPHTLNYLFNPLHPEATNFKITEMLSYPFDLRIKR